MQALRPRKPPPSVLIAVPLASAVATALLLWALLRTGLARWLAVDDPNHRSLHAAPTPRVGGLALLSVALVTSATTAQVPVSVTTGAVVLMIVGMVDDRRGLHFAMRLAVQALVAGAFVLQMTPTPSQLMMAALGALVVWSMNAFNFMDGSDGMAGGMALIGFGTCGLVAGQAGNLSLAALSLGIAGASAGFLAFNFAPARVFLGDAGSVPLGFLAASVALMGAHGGVWPGWFVPVVFSPFLADATLTLVARALTGRKVWEAHREHVYQRLVRSGLGHARTAWRAYAVMLAAAGLALLALTASSLVRDALLASWCLALVVLFFTLRHRMPAQ